MKTHVHNETDGSLPVILLAGLCGGLAEVIWVQVYASLTTHSSLEVARQVTASLLPGMADAAFAPGLGVVIHFALSVLVALVYAAVIWKPFVRQRGPAASVAVAAGVLASIWMVNFLLVLPIVNAAFVTLLPYSVSLGSKLLFGLAMASVLYTAQQAEAKSAAVHTGKARRC